MYRSAKILTIVVVGGLTGISGCGPEARSSSPYGQGGGAPQLTEDGPYPATPYLAELENTVLFGNIWERPGLSLRDRSLITVAVTQALYRTEELRQYLELALENGVTREEIAELLTHVTMYSGWPTGSNASRVAIDVYGRLGIESVSYTHLTLPTKA